ncbi:MAG: L-alanine-DL-glutamate epimerase-like enolase superfamily enzyme, partial [Rhodothermales bacterium]
APKRVLYVASNGKGGLVAIRIEQCELRILNMRTRMPFKYGIATLTALPHLLLRLEAVIDGQRAVGIASDGLAPKWFTKNPTSSFRNDIMEMFAVIQHAADSAVALGNCPTPFACWTALYDEQRLWAAPQELPPLLWGFGVSLVERALLDAFCGVRKRAFGELLREDAFGMDVSELHPELEGQTVAELLPAPVRNPLLRHTVGLGDYLTDAEIPGDEHVSDGLPQSLEACVAAYGLRCFKIKLCGDPEQDRDRLLRIAEIANRVPGEVSFTLDGNEQYRELDEFRETWEALVAMPELRDFLKGLIFVEQPLHRDRALATDTCAALRKWGKRPPMIIDESDGELRSAQLAMAGGYVGTSHKNCKGVFKGIGNACLIATREGAMMSGEDLANVGPVALQQDLAVAANLGIGHIERNGHHYFKGLSMYTHAQQEAVVDAHPELYGWLGDFATLRVEQGRIDLSNVLAAPFGLAAEIDLNQFLPRQEWRYKTLGLPC